MARRDSILVSRTLYQIGVVTLIAAVMWVAVGIYSVAGKEFVDVDPSVLQPLNPSLDQEVIQAMTGRLKVENDVVPSPAAIEQDLVTTPESTVGAQESDTINIDGVR